MENQERAISADEHLSRWASSGLSQKEYCKQNGVNLNTFAYWRHRSKETKDIPEEQNLVRIEAKPIMTDMRKAINGLLGIIRQTVSIDPCDEVIFVFCGRSRKLVKILYWDGNGFCLWQKRLETDSFPWPYDES